jgi:hypothetical protein
LVKTLPRFHPPAIGLGVGTGVKVGGIVGVSVAVTVGGTDVAVGVTVIGVEVQAVKAKIRHKILMTMDALDAKTFIENP